MADLTLETITEEHLLSSGIEETEKALRASVTERVEAPVDLDGFVSGYKEWRRASEQGFDEPVAAVADHFETRDVTRVEIAMDHGAGLVLLHDPGHSLDERILREQFGY